jgi:hypothetical protein
MASTPTLLTCKTFSDSKEDLTSCKNNILNSKKA